MVLRWERLPTAELRPSSVAAPLVWPVPFVEFHRAGVVGQRHAVAFRIVGKNVGVAAPVQSRIELPLNLVLGKVLIENIAEELERHGMVCLVLQGRYHLLQESDVGKGRFAEQILPRRNVSFSKLLPFRSDFNITLIRLSETEQRCSLYDR